MIRLATDRVRMRNAENSRSGVRLCNAVMYTFWIARTFALETKTSLIDYPVSLPAVAVLENRLEIEY